MQSRRGGLVWAPRLPDSNYCPIVFAALAVFAAGAVLLAVGNIHRRRQDGSTSARLDWGRYIIEFAIVAWILVPAIMPPVVHRASLALLAGVGAAELCGLSTLRAKASRIAIGMVGAAVVMFALVIDARVVAIAEVASLLLVVLAAVFATSLRGKLIRASLPLVPVIAGVALVHISARATPELGALARLFFLYGVIESADSAAYLIGGAFGKTPLWPRINPKKTREGAIGGWTTAMIVGACFSFCHSSHAPLRTAFIGLALGMCGLAADFATSAIKRHAGIKDFANWLPHHGSAFDAYDSLLIVAPLWHLIGGG